jgi:transcriptional regulator with GAF, ATPase, and Fis domain
MNGSVAYEHPEMRLLSGASPSEQPERAESFSKTRELRQIILKLLVEVQSLGEVRALDLKHGIDFYDEVSRLEIDLIQRALACTGGNQVRAARLLNLKVTTLNSKIKHYNINANIMPASLGAIENVALKEA